MIASPAHQIKPDAKRLKALRHQFITTPQVNDNERLKFMVESYKKTTGYPNVIRRARFYEYLLDHKTLYIDDNLFVGSLASSPNAIYTYPEWNVDWMKEEDTGAMFGADEKELHDMVMQYWDQRSLKSRTYEIFSKKYGFDPNDAINAGQVIDFSSWPGGGGNLDYPRIYNQGLASMIKEIEERQAALDLRLPNLHKYNFYEGCLIQLKAIIRLSKRYAALARDLAAKEKDPESREEYLATAEVCERVPEHPARNLREAIQCHFFCHVTAELEQPGCGYSEGYLGHDLEPFYQRDKAAGLVGPEEAIHMLQHLFVKLNEISFFYGQNISTLNSNDTGQTISLGGWTPGGEDATTEMDYLILEAQIQMRLPQPPLSLMYHNKLSGKFLAKAMECVATGIGMPQFINAAAMVQRSLNREGHQPGGITLQKARGSAGFACVATAIPHETGHPAEGEINIAKALELALNDGFDPLTRKQIGPKTGDPEKFKDFEQLYQAFNAQNDFGMKTVRHMAFLSNMINAEMLPVPWRSAMTGGCIERGVDVWQGGANYYCSSLITTGGIDAANGLMAVKKLVFDDKKLTMAELRKALAANFVGYENVQKMCFQAPKHGNDIDEVNKLVRRVYDDCNASFQAVGGNYISPDIYNTIDHFSKSFHSYFGLLTGALPTGRKAKVALTDGAVSAMPGTDTHGPTALAASAAKGIDIMKTSSSHLNVKLAPTTFKTPKGTAAVLALVKGYMDLDGGHIQFNIVDTEVLKDARVHPEKYPDLVIRVAGFSAFFTRLHPTVQDEIIERTLQDVTHGF